MHLVRVVLSHRASPSARTSPDDMHDDMRSRVPGRHMGPDTGTELRLERRALDKSCVDAMRHRRAPKSLLGA